MLFRAIQGKYIILIFIPIICLILVQLSINNTIKKQESKTLKLMIQHEEEEMGEADNLESNEFEQIYGAVASLQKARKGTIDLFKKNYCSRPGTVEMLAAWSKECPYKYQGALALATGNFDDAMTILRPSKQECLAHPDIKAAIREAVEVAIAEYEKLLSLAANPTTVPSEHDSKFYEERIKMMKAMCRC